MRSKLAHHDHQAKVCSTPVPSRAFSTGRIDAISTEGYHYLSSEGQSSQLVPNASIPNINTLGRSSGMTLSHESLVNNLSCLWCLKTSAKMENCVHLSGTTIASTTKYQYSMNRWCVESCKDAPFNGLDVHTCDIRCFVELELDPLEKGMHINTSRRIHEQDVVLLQIGSWIRDNKVCPQSS